MTLQVYLQEPRIRPRIDVAPGRWVRRMAVVVMKFLDLRHQAEVAHLKHYEGCSWCDSTERAMLADIAGCNPRRW
jgi:hypothetical protein